MDSIFHLYLNPVQESTLDESIPERSPFSDYFYINFFYVNHEIMPSATQPLDSDSITTMHRTFLVPRQMLCDCNDETVLDRDNTIFLRESFSSVPMSPETLDAMLPHIGQCAREMVAEHQGRNVWEMNVTLHITTWPGGAGDGDDVDHQRVLLSASQIADSLKQVGTAELPSYCAEQCAICLEEFCNGLKSELVSTKCLHVFHKDCVVQWLQRCICRTCPLCRQIC